jgi:lipopolysaccharide heptosyltransferase II
VPKPAPALDPASPAKIVLLRPRRIGDIILTTPAVAALKRALPKASLTYVVEAPFARLVEGHPDLDKVIVIKPKLTTRDSLRLVRTLRREKFDAVIDFHGGPRTSLWTFLSGARLKVGYLIRGRGWPYDIAIPRGRAEGPIHSAENHLNLVRALGIAVAGTPGLALPPARPEEKARLDRLFKENTLKGTKVVVLHIGAGNAFRDWGLDSLTGLARRLAAMPGVRVVLAGGEADCGRAEEMIGRGNLPALSLVGELNLIELRELIARAALFVGPDSGPMHLAASTGTPIVAVFGPTLPAHFAPWRRKAVIVQKDLACRPCKQRECGTGDFRCLRTISVDEVFGACRPFLAAKPRKAGLGRGGRI